jgi:hypothetical protein
MTDNHVMLVSGDMLDPFNPDPDMLTIPVIAHHLAMQCRFNGACRRFYSVAEHSVNGAAVAWALFNEDKPLARAMLLHDAHEAILGDIVSPIKKPDLLGPDAPIWHAVDAIDLAIQERYDVSFDDDRIKTIDNHMLGVEWRALMPEPERYAHLIQPGRSAYVSAVTAPAATRWFTRMAREIGLYNDK